MTRDACPGKCRGTPKEVFTFFFNLRGLKYCRIVAPNVLVSSRNYVEIFLCFDLLLGTINYDYYYYSIFTT